MQTPLMVFYIYLFQKQQQINGCNLSLQKVIIAGWSDFTPSVFLGKQQKQQQQQSTSALNLKKECKWTTLCNLC